MIESRKERDPNNIFPVPNTIDQTIKSHGVKLMRDLSGPALLKFFENQTVQEPALMELSRPSYGEVSSTPDYVVAKINMKNIEKLKVSSSLFREQT